MTYYQDTRDAVLPCERFPLSALGEGPGTDYSEEAIPERDPAYRMSAGTLCEEPTVEAMPAEVRLALRRRLEQLGMSAVRAAAVASL